MDRDRSITPCGRAGGIWGLGGVVALLGSAVGRLAPLAGEAFSHDLTGVQWSALVAIVVGMAYAEGYHGFQARFSPRVAARARYLSEHPRPAHILFAPLFCMGYFHATRRRRITSYSLTVGIVLLIVAVHFVSQPWRGIIDAGVVVGLVWGIVTVLLFGVRAFAERDFPYSPDVPA